MTGLIDFYARHCWTHPPRGSRVGADLCRAGYCRRHDRHPRCGYWIAADCDGRLGTLLA